MEHQSIPQLLKQSGTADPAKTAYSYKKSGQWVEIPWSEAYATTQKLARALMALGVKKDDKVAVLASTRLEWVYSDFGIVSCGAVTVGIYPSNLPEDCAYILNHSDTEVLILEDESQLAKITEVRDQVTLRHIVILDGASDASKGVMSWEDFLAHADKIEPAALEARVAELGPDDLASLVYTSGTTGVPKGVMITHGNLLFTTWSASQAIYTEGHFVTLLFLPLAHVFARMIVYTCLSKQLHCAFCEDVTKVADNLKEVRPHFLPSVPRIYEKVYDKVVSGVEQAGGMKKKIFDWALGVGMEVSALKQAGRTIPGFLGLKYKIATKLVFHKIQEALGGRMVFAISGAAPLNKTIAEFFHACGVLILEGLGMTENTSFTNVNKITQNKFGTVGPVGPGIEQRIAEDGEVMFRGKNIMKGYYKNDESTAETITKDGWLLTGDIGEIDADGFLKITDRKKDLIITAGGKNVAPQRIERTMRTSHYIAQFVAYGDKRKYLAGLVTLEPEAIQKWASENGLAGQSVEQLAQNEQVRALIDSEIHERNKELASFETIKKFAILPRDFSIEDGELTPTLKLKRKVIYSTYAAELDSLY